MPLHGIDHVELWTGNAAQAAHFYVHALGFTEVAYAGLETGVRDRASRVLARGDIRLVLDRALRPSGEIGDAPRAPRRWREGHRAAVADADAAYHTAVRARRARRPGAVGGRRRARRRAHGHHRHLRRHRPYLRPARRLRGRFSARLRAAPTRRPRGDSVSPRSITSSATSSWARWTSGSASTTMCSASRELLHFDDQDISTEYSALMCKVMQNGHGQIKFPINEPAEGRRKTPDRRVPGVLRRPRRAAHRPGHRRHPRAPWMRCSGAASRSCACRTPTTTSCPSASARSPRTIDELARLGILVDRDDEGYLLQIFTQPLRPADAVHRGHPAQGRRGFGKGNFKALFEAIEREQALRGNLEGRGSSTVAPSGRRNRRTVGSRSVEPPAGTIALLFHGHRGVDGGWLPRSGAAWPEVLAEHHALVGGAIAAEGGFVDRTEGDAFFATFADAAAARARGGRARCAALRAHAWPPEVGRAARADGPARRASSSARRRATSGSRSTARRAWPPPRTAASCCDGGGAGAGRRASCPSEPVGAHRLKDFPAPEPLFCAVVDGRGAAAFPPPRAHEVRPTNLPAGDAGAGRPRGRPASASAPRCSPTASGW